MAIPYGINPREVGVNPREVGVNPRAVGPDPAQAGNVFNRRMFQPTTAQPLRVAGEPIATPSPVGIMAAAPQVQGFQPPTRPSPPTRVAARRIAPPPPKLTPDPQPPSRPRSVSDWLGQREIGRMDPDRLPGATDESILAEWDILNDFLRLTRAGKSPFSPDEDLTQEQIVEATAHLLADRSEIANEAWKRGIELPGLTEDDVSAAGPTPSAAGPTPSAAGEPTVRQVNAVTNKVSNLINKSVDEGKVPPEVAAAADKAGKAQVNALKNSEKDLQSQLDGLGLDFKADDWRQKAEEILGMPVNDVPAWAAPMFLFGLQLMQGPVSSKRQGDSMLMGLAADVGAAGTVAFKDFRAIQERKRRERAEVGKLAYQLKKSSDATKTALYKTKLESSRWWMTYGLKAKTEERLTAAEAASVRDKDRDFFAQQDERITNRYVKGDNPEHIIRFGMAFNAQIEKILDTSPEKGGGAKGVKSLYENPAALNLAGALAAKNAGLVPEFKTTTIEFGPDSKLTYSVNALEKRARDKKITPGALLTQIVNDPHAKKWAGIALAVNMGKDQIKMTLPDAEGVVTPTWINVADERVEYAAAKKANRKINPKAFTKTGDPYLKTDQNFTKLALGKDDAGREKWAFVNWPKLALINAKRRVAKKDALDMLDILKSPSKAPGVVSPKYSDTSGALNNLSTVEINTGTYETQDFLFNKNILSTKKTEIAKKLGLEPEDVTGLVASGQKIPWEDLIELGVFVPLGKPRTHKKPITKTIMGIDGTWKTVTASLGEHIGMEKAADRAVLDNQLINVMQANRQSFIVTNILEELGPEAVKGVSKWADVLGKVTAAGRLVGFKTGSLTKLRDFDLAAGSTSADRTATNDLISNWEKKFDTWAIGNIKIQEERQRLKSLFIDMAFNLASAREKGKLTDKDVDWAFRTLGFDADTYLQNPSVVLAGLKEATTTINTGMEFRLMGIHESGSEIREWNRKNPNDQRFILEEVIKARWSGVDPGDSQGFYTTPEGTKIYRFDKAPVRGARVPVQTPVSGTGEAQQDTSIVTIPENLRKGHIFGNLHSKQITNVPANLQTVWQDLKNQIGTVSTGDQTKKWAKSYVDKRIQEFVKAGGTVNEAARKRYQKEATDLLIFLDGIK